MNDSEACVAIIARRKITAATASAEIDRVVDGTSRWVNDSDGRKSYIPDDKIIESLQALAG